MINKKQEENLTKLIHKTKDEIRVKNGIEINKEIIIPMDKSFELARAYIIQSIKEEKDLLINLTRDETKTSKKTTNKFKGVTIEEYKHILKYLPDSITLEDADKTLDFNGLVLYAKDELGIIISKYLTPKEAKEQIKIEEALAEKENLKRMKEEEQKIIDNWKKQFNPSMVIQSPAYFEMEKYIEMVCKNLSNFCIVASAGGLAKTWSSQAILHKKKIDYAYLNSFTSPLELYNFLYDNAENKVILIDDTEGIWDNKAVISLLKNATELNGDRTISWNSTTSKLQDRNNTSKFTSRIILLTNQIPNINKNPHIQALINRAFVCRLNFSYKEKMDIISEVSKKKYKTITSTTRGNIFDFIKRNTSEATQDLSIRTLIKCYHFYMFDKNIWQELAIKLLKADPRKELVIKLGNSGMPVKNQIQEYFEKTGHSRADFFRVRKEIIPKIERYPKAK